MDETPHTPAPAEAQPHAFPGPPPSPPEPGSWSGPWPGPSPAPQRRRPSRALLGAAAAITAGALGAGMGIGYAAFSRGSSPSASTSSASSTPIAAVDPGLVNIDTVLGYQTGGAAGTGMVLTPTGIVLTNNHVVDGATSVHATDVGNGRTYSATVLGYDTSADVAVLRLTGASGLSTVSLGSSSNVAVGQSVIALGNAGGAGGTPKVARGTVTALDQSITAGDQGSSRTEHLTGLIQTDAPIQPGDSGGPLVDAAGRVVGMDTAASTGGGSASPFAAAGTATAEQAYAIPIDTALTVASAIEHGVASSSVHIGATAFLGVEVASSATTGPGGGATVVGVERGSPAASAGLKGGDTITGIGGTAVTSSTELSAAIDRLHPGATVTLRWVTPTGAAVRASVQLATGPVG